MGERKKTRGDRRKALRQADAEGRRTLGRCRLRLVMFFGQNFNAQWDAAGFPDRSTQVPESQAKRAALLSRLAGWFGGHPELESADMQATAADCEAAKTAYQAARTAVNRGKSELRVAVKAKNQAIRKLRDRFRSLIDELTILLAEDDPRWRLFGLHLPAQLSAPRPVPSAQAERLADGGWSVTWKHGRYARRYRVQLQPPDAAPAENLVTVRGFEVTLPPRDFPPGSRLQIIAANDAGEAAACVAEMRGAR